MVFPVVVSLVAALAGHPVDTRCDAPNGDTGRYTPTPVVHLYRDYCRELARMSETHTISDLSGEAVMAASHEAMHASGRPHWANETLTECRAMQVAPRAARLLGLSWSTIRALMPALRKEHRYMRSFAGYHDFTCS